MARFVPFLLLSAVVTFSSAWAADPATESTSQESRPAAGESRNDLDQGAIYRILCGGSVEADTGLSRHLWAMAGHLAAGEWTPPKVTIRVVVSDPKDR